MTVLRIPFNVATFTGREREHIEQALKNLRISADGPFSRRCSELLQQELGVRKVLLTTSCTDALEMCGLLLDLKPGDEVIMPSFTFVSTANAFALRGARPAFVDIRPDTFNVDERLIEAAIGPRTKAIAVVHYAGVGCELEAIQAIARKHGLVLIEDNAHGLFGRWHGQPLGSFGALSTLSFHETKNISCGEGGALCISDPALVERAEILLTKGTDRSRFLRGLVDKYTWVDVGSSFGLSDLLAAVLWGQLEQHQAIMAARRSLHQRYQVELAEPARQRGWHLPLIPPGAEISFHMSTILTCDQGERDALISFLAERGVSAVFHYVPLHTSAMGRHFGYTGGQFPVSEDVSRRLVRLPLFTTLSEADQAEVLAAVRDFAAAAPGAST